MPGQRHGEPERIQGERAGPGAGRNPGHPYAYLGQADFLAARGTRVSTHRRDQAGAGEKAGTFLWDRNAQNHIDRARFSDNDRLPHAALNAGAREGSRKQLHHGTHSFSYRVRHFVLRPISENGLIPETARRLLGGIGPCVAIDVIGGDILISHRPHLADEKTKLIEAFGRIR